MNAFVITHPRARTIDLWRGVAWLCVLWLACATGCIGTMETRFRVRDPNAVTLRLLSSAGTYEEVVAERPQSEAVVHKSVLGTWIAARHTDQLQLTQRTPFVPGTSYGARLMTSGWVGTFPQLASELFDPSADTWRIYDTVPRLPQSCAQRGDLASNTPIETTRCPATHFTIELETPTRNVIQIEQRERVNRGIGFAPLTLGLLYGALGYWMSTSDSPWIRVPGYVSLGIGITTASVGAGVALVGLVRPARNEDITLQAATP